MDIKKTLIAYNPKSGRFSKEKLSYILSYLKNKGIYSEGLDLTEKYVDKEFASRFDAVLVAGGDGSLNSVVNRLVFTDIPVAQLPIGTVNLFCLENKTPFSLPAALNEIIYKYRPLRIPLGKANDQYFLEMAGIGFDAFLVKIMEERLGIKSQKRHFFDNFFKYLSFIINIIKILTNK